MSRDHKLVSQYITDLLEGTTLEQLEQRLDVDFSDVLTTLPIGNSARRQQSRLAALDISDEQRELIGDDFSVNEAERYTRNIENYVGTMRIPLGVAGPLRVNGLYAKGDYIVPLATTEAALVASYHRGSLLLSAAGGCRTMLLAEGVSRAPGFIFETMSDSGRFIIWILEQFQVFCDLVRTTSAHAQLDDVCYTLEGNHVYLNLQFSTGDAAGQNMVTIAAQSICNYIMEHCPTKPKRYFVEANMSGDKKASQQSFQSVRGRKVTAEVVIPAALLQSQMHVTPAALADYWRMSAVGGVLCSTIGCQGHYANGLAALYLATGQDVACVAESAVGLTRMEVTDAGDLYASVMLPNIIVGTVGGGTTLPTQTVCLDMLGLTGTGHARALAEVCCGLCLAGEVSLMSALVSGDFTRAHEFLARRKHGETESACDLSQTTTTLPAAGVAQ